MSHLSMQELSASLDGGLTGSALEQAVAHLATCHACRDRQARLVKHDDALRRLLAADPDDRLLDALARRSEELVAAVVRGLPVPPLATLSPRRDDDEPHVAERPAPAPRAAAKHTEEEKEKQEAEKAREDVRRILDALESHAATSTPPPPASPTTSVAPATTAPPAPTENATTPEAAPPAPVESTTPPAGASVTPPSPPADTAPEPASAAPPVAPLRAAPARGREPAEVEPFFDELRFEPSEGSSTSAASGPAEASRPASGENSRPASGASPGVVHDGDGYDSFNDGAYAGPLQREGPPPVSSAPSLPPKAPPARGPASDAARFAGPYARAAAEPPAKPHASADPAPRAEVFGVARKSQPAWERMGLEPDPFAPGQFRPAADAAEDETPRGRTPRSTYAPAPRTAARGMEPALVAALVSVGVLATVVLVLRFTPAGLHLPHVEFPGRGQPAPVASTRGADVREASTRPPVETLVRPAPPADSADRDSARALKTRTHPR